MMPVEASCCVPPLLLVALLHVLAWVDRLSLHPASDPAWLTMQVPAGIIYVTLSMAYAHCWDLEPVVFPVQQ
jgi:hypothetical protein